MVFLYIGINIETKFIKRKKEKYLNIYLINLIEYNN